jgi:cellulose 1,4-beta-cellobiosidase
MAPEVTIYMDSAHGGWLGWSAMLEKHLDNLDELDVLDKIRGFALNTANYQPLGVQCPFYDWCLGGKNANDTCCTDPCKLVSQYNSGNNEHNFALLIANMTAERTPDFQPRFIIDTGRNGGPGDMRESCSNWCNIRNAGMGLLPTSKTAYPTMVDAYLWLKTPGESDGCTQLLPGPGDKQCPRYDSMCGSPDSIGSEASEPRAPEAGKWFDYQVSFRVGPHDPDPHEPASHPLAGHWFRVRVGAAGQAAGRPGGARLSGSRPRRKVRDVHLLRNAATVGGSGKGGDVASR